MSEYQYYEFQTLDRPLTGEQIKELRSISSRAEITPTRFTNSYSYGDFRGDERELLERYFDAHVYIANWGTHTLMFGMPASAVDLEALQSYQSEGGFAVQARGGRVILTFDSRDENGGDGWVDDDEGPAWMGLLISLRADIMGGDLRAAYLGWLRGLQAGGADIDEDDNEEDDEDNRIRLVAQRGDADGDRVEPPVPPGLGSLTGPLKSLVEFLDLDEDLVAVAAEASERLTVSEPSTREQRRWIEALPDAEKSAFLLRLLQGDVQVQPELRRRFRAATAVPAQPSATERRTVRELLDAADTRAVERTRQEAEAAAKERARRAEEAARARDLHLRSLRGRERDLWSEAGRCIDTKKPKEYDRAVEIMTDLRELAVRGKESAEFENRLQELRTRHGSKPSFIKRLDAAGLH